MITSLIVIHTAASIVAIILSAALFLRPKGNSPHKILGWTWCLAFLLAMTSALATLPLSGVSPFHILAIIALVFAVFVPLSHRRADSKKALATHIDAAVWSNFMLIGAGLWQLVIRPLTARQDPDWMIYLLFACTLGAAQLLIQRVISQAIRLFSTTSRGGR